MFELVEAARTGTMASPNMDGVGNGLDDLVEVDAGGVVVWSDLLAKIVLGI